MENSTIKEKQELIEQISTIMQKYSALSAFGMGEMSIVKSAIEEQLQGKSLEELRDEYEMLKNTVAEIKKR